MMVSCIYHGVAMAQALSYIRHFNDLVIIYKYETQLL